MNLQSTEVIAAKSQQECYEFLSAPKNYELLMPENIQKFALNDQGGFIFQLSGMPEIRLKLEEKKPVNQIIWSSASEKFPFTLTTNLQEIGAAETGIQFLFHGQFNSMISMMVKKPLSKFLEKLSENVQTKL